MNLSEMTFTDYRHSFRNVEEFENAFSKLTEEEVRGMIARDNANPTVKACMMQSWRHYHDKDASEHRITKEMVDTFNEKWSLNEYREMIKICLIDHYSWSEYRTDPELLARRMEEEDSFIREEYLKHSTPMDVAADVGYCCG